MKVAANAVAVLAWGSFLAALWLMLLAETRPAIGLLIAVLVVSFLAGLILPAFLLGIPVRVEASERLLAAKKAQPTARRPRGDG